MPLDASSPVYLHILQNVALTALCICSAPLCTFIAICSQIASPYSTVTKDIQQNRQWRARSSSGFRPRTILVTGVGMTKGLAISRAFYREGHIVIGADFEPCGIPVCGRFSTALKKFYRLPKPVSATDGSPAYVEGLMGIIKKENVELWVSCSGVGSTVDDAEAAETIERYSNCKAIQFGALVTQRLHDKHSFIQQAQLLGLKVPETHLVNSIEDTIEQLYTDKPRTTGNQFIMKSIGLDDTIRADMTLLPRPSAEDTRKHLRRLNPSISRPFVIQQFISGPEYCTHSVVIRGQVVAFTACPSTDLLMHYQALHPESALSRAMQKYTQEYAEKMGQLTGHFSIDFMLDEYATGLKPGLELMERLYPIECNPRAHTAVVLLEQDSKEMVGAYLSIFDDYESVRSRPPIIVTPSTTVGYYWIGHDVVTCLVLPLLSLLMLRSNFSSLFGKWREFLEHITSWKDGTYVRWDPWPFWWLYCVYWPGVFLSIIFTGSWWSRCNVSTTKVFGC